MHELLTPAQMSEADQLTIKAGTPGIELMENAGLAVVEAVNENFSDAKNILIVCGPGNNGGDGFVAARHLAAQGLGIAVLICGDKQRISGDAAEALARLDASLLCADDADFSSFDLIVDALFGAGLDREIGGAFAETIKRINASQTPVLAVDLPSGINGANGQEMGCSVSASHTVTFFRYKPGHFLMPGRARCGTRTLHQIGIEPEVLKEVGKTVLINHPDIWSSHYPFPAEDGHKYSRGHTLVVSGPFHATGAARLSAQAALRSGSGLVTLASPNDAVPVNAAHLTSVMLCEANTPQDIVDVLSDTRFNCVVIGPGLPPDQTTMEVVTAVLATGRKTILDAGALTAFSEHADTLFAAIKSSGNDVFLTPHEGEFARLFPDANGIVSKIERTQSAAQMSGATIILKGPDTVIATPSAKVSVCDHAPPWLATAGSGDVLAGIVAGLSAQGMPAFEAASAAVWLHADAARQIGPGLISTDLDEGLRQSIKEFSRSVAGLC